MAPRRKQRRDITAAERAAQAKAAENKRKIKVEKPDLEKIKEETLNPRSNYYYPKLLEKYWRNDTVMTNEEYRNLYPGYMFQEDYDPYRTSPYSGVTDAPARKGNPHKGGNRHHTQICRTLPSGQPFRPEADVVFLSVSSRRRTKT